MTKPYTDEQRAKAKALHEACAQAWQAYEAFIEDNADKVAEIDAKYKSFREAMDARHERECDALDLEVRKACGTAALYDTATAADKAADENAKGEGYLMTHNDGRLILCGTSGKPMFHGERVMRSDGKWHLAAEYETVHGKQTVEA